MDTLLKELTGQIRIGAKQAHENMTLFCLITEQEAVTDFITLDSALEKEYLIVSEISKDGSVPELRVVNVSDRKILLLDGEELVGAKQNRVLNTTILIAPKSETIIPVSCVEHGRWSYRGARFASRSRSMSAQMRKRNSESVAQNLREGHEFRSDQSRVWKDIEDKYRRMSVDHSPTMAMSDLYESLNERSGKYLKAFSPVCAQIGMIILIDQQLAGMELINRFSEFRLSHKKLVNSYVLDALETATPDYKPDRRSFRSMVEKFLESMTEASVEHRRSVGLGNDFRLSSKTMIGAGLEYEKGILQVSAFPLANSRASETHSPLRRASARKRSVQR